MPQQFPEGAQPARGCIHLAAAPGERGLHSGAMNRHVLNIRADVSTPVVWKSGLFFPPHPSSVDIESDFGYPQLFHSHTCVFFAWRLGRDVGPAGPQPGPFQPQPQLQPSNLGL